MGGSLLKEWRLLRAVDAENVREMANVSCVFFALLEDLL